jgi:hypothetical protein
MGVPGSANFLLAGSQGYRIERSLRFNSADSAYLNRTPAGSGTGAGRTWTWSGWVKRGKSTPSDLQLLLSASSSRSGFGFFTSSGGGTGSDSFSIYHGASFATRVETTQVFRDFSSWYHIVVSVDTTQATAANRIRIYVNGSEVTQFSTASYPAQNYQFGICEATAHAIGRDASAAAYYFDGYLTESYLIDGQALTPSSFGETDTITGVWKPKKDSSGNSNNWTPNNFSVTAGAGNDSLIDTPTPYADGGNGRGNYATMNPLACGVTLTNGNLELTTATNYASSTLLGTSTLEMATGSWYWEAAKTSGTSTILWIGIVSAATATISSSIFVYGSDGTYYQSGSTVATGKATYATNDVIGIALNSNTKSIEFYKNGVSQGSYTVSFSGPYYVTAYDGDSGASCTFSFSFGQRPFAYTPPSGFVALNTQNLPEPSIKKPSSYFDATTYTGNGATPQNIVNASGFQPDLVWTKSRSNAVDHFLADSVRGANNILRSNLADAEVVGTGGIAAFNSNGFSVNGNQNTNTYTYVGWQWKESATPGFDIVTYTGTGSNQTISHSLGVAPAMYITKRRNATNSWVVYHRSLGNNILALESTSAVIANSAFFSSNPNSSSFYPATDATVNASGGTYVTYLWSEVAGFSKFGSYTGNGSSDGPFLHCGFRPAFVIIKSSSSGYDWFMFDNRRDPENVVDLALFPNSSSAESGAGTYLFDFTSNGIKIRNSQLNLNGNGNTYIFCAWAEAPFKYALAR